jgi:acetylglutamate kinase
MANLYIIKIGGNIIDEEEKLSSFLKSFAELSDQKILIHGGGKVATKLATDLKIPQQLVNGRRITDAETLKIVTMVYAGLINKNIIAKLQQNGCNAVGITGVDANLIEAHKRTGQQIDYGFAGDIDSINTEFLQVLLSKQYVPVIAPITHDKKGQLLNTNADTIAQEIAKSLSSLYETHLIYSFEKAGVLKNIEDEQSVIKRITLNEYIQLKEGNIINGGMIPKLDNAFAALAKGVRSVRIGKAEKIQELIQGNTGTTIINE